MAGRPRIRDAGRGARFGIGRIEQGIEGIGNIGNVGNIGIGALGARVRATRDGEPRTTRVALYARGGRDGGEMESRVGSPTCERIREFRRAETELPRVDVVSISAGRLYAVKCTAAVADADAMTETDAATTTTTTTDASCPPTSKTRPCDLRVGFGDFGDDDASLRSGPSRDVRGGTPRVRGDAREPRSRRDLRGRLTESETPRGESSRKRRRARRDGDETSARRALARRRRRTVRRWRGGARRRTRQPSDGTSRREQRRRVALRDNRFEPVGVRRTVSRGNHRRTVPFVDRAESSNESRRARRSAGHANGRVAVPSAAAARPLRRMVGDGRLEMSVSGASGERRSLSENTRRLSRALPPRSVHVRDVYKSGCTIRPPRATATRAVRLLAGATRAQAMVAIRHDDVRPIFAIRVGRGNLLGVRGAFVVLRPRRAGGGVRRRARGDIPARTSSRTPRCGSRNLARR